MPPKRQATQNTKELTTSLQKNVDRLKETNAPPSDIERVQIAQVLDAEKQDERSLAAKKAKAHEAFLKIEEEHQTMLERVARLRHVLHPIRKVPNEIIYRILEPLIENAIPVSDEEFLQYPYWDIDTMDDENPATLMSTLNVQRHPLWIFSHVCTQWRNVILTSPRLWSTIHLSIDRDRQANSFASTSLIRLIMTRSQDHPLRISIHDPSGVLSSSTSIAEVFGNAHRWKKLYIHSNLAGICMLRFSGDDFPLLKSVHFHFRVSGNATLNTTTCFTGFMSAPKLRSFIIVTDSNEGHIAFNSRVRVPWSQLTDAGWFEMGNESTLTKTRLRDMKSLKSLKLLGGVQPISHPSLRFLAVSYLYYRECVASAKLPALQGLDITDVNAWEKSRSGGYSYNTSSRLAAIPRAIGAKLKELCVPLVFADPAEMDALGVMLRSTPALKTLELLGCSSGVNTSVDSLWTFLAGTSKEVPRLTSLTLRVQLGCQSLHLSDNFNTMIKSRRQGTPGVQKLTKVVADQVCLLSDTVMSGFQEFLDAGMDGYMLPMPHDIVFQYASFCTHLENTIVVHSMSNVTSIQKSQPSGCSVRYTLNRDSDAPALFCELSLTESRVPKILALEFVHHPCSHVANSIRMVHTTNVTSPATMIKPNTV